MDEPMHNQSAQAPDSTAASPVAETLGKGLLDIYQPALEDSKDHIDELLNGQNRLINLMQQENGRFKECEYTYNIAELLQQVRTYHGKLTRIKKQTNSIQEKSAKLKRRSVRLKEQTEARAERARLDRIRARQREEQLVAKFAGPST
ncbi:biogenesis of lysosome-related organelles complex 1 subunit 6-like [Pollicipes pollicipes]|uniref:biogenesis of lysosome-related organelles complex 1 subunit 6-like n=1 Tax=Pollicipes pollicipes TaxID=41117 RepID=UPI00188496C7|nr:biogenesis of lysosome-related organelles complex 1 subunit 6-like [Pollicipes pollicipes]XP_037080577.1 biogenesis of lysosome-related organelles complex 1 subunit 6-like [Pollicipes pollicipes]XP_037080578.1 biogenesis of lysosome-related organelles complex 1 subunit 6-like [Pollicipes pollicipes]